MPPSTKWLLKIRPVNRSCRCKAQGSKIKIKLPKWPRSGVAAAQNLSVATPSHVSWSKSHQSPPCTQSRLHPLLSSMTCAHSRGTLELSIRQNSRSEFYSNPGLPFAKCESPGSCPSVSPRSIVDLKSAPGAHCIVAILPMAVSISDNRRPS